MVVVEPIEPRGLRADAARNRAAVVAAATEAFAEAGRGVDVREIAQRAGVGVGTVYRHFPTKADLLQTVLREQYLSWARAAVLAADAEADPWQALVGFVEDALDRQARDVAVCEDLAALAARPDPRCLTELRPLIDRLVARGHRAGCLRPHVTSADVVLLLVALGHAAQAAGPGRGQARRLVELTLYGIAGPAAGRDGDRSV